MSLFSLDALFGKALPFVKTQKKAIAKKFPEMELKTISFLSDYLTENQSVLLQIVDNKVQLIPVRLIETENGVILEQCSVFIEGEEFTNIPVFDYVKSKIEAL